MYLIDTDVAVHLRDGTGGVGGRLSDLGVRPALSILTLAELEGGVAAHAVLRARRRRSIEVMAAALDVIPLDRPIVVAYRTILHDTGFSRRRVVDRLIAATAIVHDLTLVTINGDDFRDVPGLSLEVWPAQ